MHRVVFIGDSGVGKTSLINRIVQKEFSQAQPTTGAAFYSLSLWYANQQIQIQVWDTAGQEKYKSLGPIYFRKAVAAIAVFDLSMKDSLEGLRKWIDLYREYSDDKYILVVGNKQDLEDSIVFQIDDTNEWAKSLDSECLWASAKTGVGVDDILSLLGAHLTDMNENENENINSPEQPQPRTDQETICC